MGDFFCSFGWNVAVVGGWFGDVCVVTYIHKIHCCFFYSPLRFACHCVVLSSFILDKLRSIWTLSMSIWFVFGSRTHTMPMHDGYARLLCLCECCVLNLRWLNVDLSDGRACSCAHTQCIVACVSVCVRFDDDGHSQHEEALYSTQSSANDVSACNMLMPRQMLRGILFCSAAVAAAATARTVTTFYC